MARTTATRLHPTTNQGSKGVYTMVGDALAYYDITTYLTHGGHATMVWITTPDTVARLRELEPGAVATTPENVVVQHTNTVMRVMAHANPGGK